MAEADSKPTSETWTPLSTVHEPIVEICVSPSEAGPWLVERITTEKVRVPGKVRVRWRSVRPAGASINDFWTGSPPAIDFKDNSATKIVVLPSEAATGLYSFVLLGSVTLLGVEVVREDIKPIATPAPVVTLNRKDWFRIAKRTFPRRPGETKADYAAGLREEMKKAGITPVWSQENMERRLRDRDEAEKPTIEHRPQRERDEEE